MLRLIIINAGLTESFMERTIPEVSFTNSDGFLPDIEIKTDGNSSLITFHICQKLAVDEHVFPTNLSIPYIVLALDMVSFLLLLCLCVTSRQQLRSYGDGATA